MSPKILIVDDEEDILRSTQMLLRLMGHESVTLRDAAHTVAVAAKERPDLILQDLRMPGFDPDTFLRDLKADPQTRHIPFAFFSASPDVRSEATLHEAQGYLAKPFRQEDLRALIERTLPATTAARRANA